MRRRALLAAGAAALLLPAAPAGATLYGDGVRTTSGVTAYWPLDEATAPIVDVVGGRSATPSFGYTLGRPPGIDGGGTSLSLSGTSAASFGNVNNFAADRTVEAWVAPTTISGDRYVVSKGTTTAGYHLYLGSGGVPTFQVNSTRITAPAIPAGGWHHLAATLSGRTMALYVDGQPAGAGTVSNAPSTSSQSLWLGRLSRTSSGWFQGGLDEVALYNRALDAAAVAARFASGVDRSVPQITFTAQPDPVSDRSDGTISFTGSKGGLTFTCALDDAAATACAGSYSYDLLRDGAHSLTVTATDRWGTSSSASAEWQVALPEAELAAPETTLVTAPSALTNSTTAQLAFAGNKTRLTFACRIDAGTWTTCTDSVTYSALKDGQHTAEVRATDRWGAVEEVPAAVTWRVDLGAPETVAVVARATTAGPGSAVLASENGARFDCRTGTGAWGPCVTAFALPLVTTATTMSIRATDAAGNPDLTPASVTVDPLPATDPDGVTASFAVVGAKTGTTGLRCRLDDEPVASCPTGMTFTGLSFGDHRLVVSDPALPDVVFPAIAWTNARPSDDELASPVVTLGAAPAALSNSSSARFSFTASKTRVAFSCRLDGGSWVACPVGAAYANLAEGEHTFEVRGTDRYGTTGEIRSFTWRIDVTPPATLILATRATAADPGSVVLASEPGATFECKRGEGAWSACPPAFALPALTAPEQLRARAVDGAGNTDATPPVAALEPPEADPAIAFSGGRAGFVLAGNGPVSALRCSLDGATASACPWPLELEGLGYGRHTLSVADPAAAAHGVTAATIAWENPLPRPSIVGSQFPALLQLGSRRRQASLATSRLPRLLFQSNSAGTATVTLQRGGRTVRRWKARVVQGSNLVRLPRGAWAQLRPGRHTLRVVVANASGTSAPLTLRFDAVRTTRR